MPRSTSTSSTASDGAASSSAAGGGEETTDGANRKKLTSQEKDKVREQKKSLHIFRLGTCHIVRFGTFIRYIMLRQLRTLQVHEAP